jgi:hypothetical protein
MISLVNSFGQLDVGAVTPEQIASLDPDTQKLLAVLFDAIRKREAAAERVRLGVRALDAANREQIEAAAENAKANPAPTFQQSHAASVASYTASQIKGR